MARVRAQAESGQLRNFVEGKYESWGKVDILAYRSNDTAYLPGTSVRVTAPGQASGPPEVRSTASSTSPSRSARGTPRVPRGYLIPAELSATRRRSCASTT